MKRTLFVFLLLLASNSFSKNVIQDYQRIFLPIITANGSQMIALRVFKMNNSPSFLVVDPNSLETKIMPITGLNSQSIFKKRLPTTLYHWKMASTRYYQLLIKNTSAPYLLENQGITHAEHSVSQGNILTIDMCPSNKPFETNFFNRLVQLSETANKPVPITIAISGLWLIEHPDEFKWLQSKEKEKKLAITWANHSFSHIYYRDLPYSKNFLISTSTNIDTEILLTEKYLLEEGEIPSIFFRFPGLVSNKNLMKTIREYGLIPLGTDAWIADLETKHQAITPGGIILVHGNSNEHQGIELLTPLLNNLTLKDIKSSI